MNESIYLFAIFIGTNAYYALCVFLMYKFVLHFFKNKFNYIAKLVIINLMISLCGLPIKIFDSNNNIHYIAAIFFATLLFFVYLHSIFKIGSENYLGHKLANPVEREQHKQFHVFSSSLSLLIYNTPISKSPYQHGLFTILILCPYLDMFNRKPITVLATYLVLMVAMFILFYSAILYTKLFQE